MFASNFFLTSCGSCAFSSLRSILTSYPPILLDNEDPRVEYTKIKQREVTVQIIRATDT
jgi:hypothetical protein